MNYIWNGVIINPTSDEAKNAIGKEVYFANNPKDCLNSANISGAPYQVLKSLDLLSEFPFVVADGTQYACIIVKTTSAYEWNQSVWVEDHCLKEGTFVKVLRKARKYEYDWADTWVLGMDGYIGGVHKVTQICPNGIELDSEYIFPYFVLEKVSDGYEPFASAEEFLVGYSSQFKDDPDMLTSAIWLRSVAGVYSLVTEIWSDGVVVGNDADITSWEDLLEDWVFLNGTPCGKSKGRTIVVHFK